MASFTRFAATHKWLVGTVAVACAAVIAFVLVYYQPQDLLIAHTVHQSRPAKAVVVRQGSFHSGEHHTTGTAALLTVPDGATTLRLAPFQTSNGPAVHVWLSQAAPGSANGTIARSGHLDLGALKGTIGDQNYALPRTANPASYRTVVIWCQRFSVTFGYAGLAVAPSPAA